jgi:hypothetical protein
MPAHTPLTVHAIALDSGIKLANKSAKLEQLSCYRHPDLSLRNRKSPERAEHPSLRTANNDFLGTDKEKKRAKQIEHGLQTAQKWSHLSVPFISNEKRGVML